MTGIVKTDQIQGAQGTTVTVPTGNTLAVTSNATVGGTLGVTGIGTFADDIVIGDGKTIGSASKTDAITIASSGLTQLRSTGIGAGSQVFQVIDDGATLFQLRAEDGNISFPQAGAGIYLGVTAGNSANLLNDYEEGTFTPAISMTDNAGSLAYSAQTGYYTKIGDLVHIQLYVQVSNVSGIAGQVRIGGLPFTPANVTNGYIAGSIWLNSLVSGQPFDGDFMITTYLAPNDPTIRMYSLDGDGGVNQLTAGHIGSSTDFMLQYNYKV